MDVSVNADVQCADGLCGRSAYIIVDPVVKKVTHVVVREKSLPHAEYLVPLDLVVESTPDLIRLRCARDELRMQESFTELEFIERDPLYLGDEFDMDEGLLMWPHVAPEDMTIPVEYERVPPGELAVRRGTHVNARDGRIGRVDEFLVDPANGHITHLVLREGHLWGQEDVTIPISEIARVEEDTVYLKLDKQGIEALPKIQIRRQHRTWCDGSP
jgi:sporulation protein YlmC with PRC-barrel domain